MNGVQACFVGRLGTDPEKKYTQTGQAMLTFSVAVADEKAGDGAETEWVKVVCWGDLAEKLETELLKGHLVYVEGRCRLNVWQSKNGEQRSGLNLSAWAVQQMGVGRRRPQQTRDSAGADDLQDAPSPRESAPLMRSSTAARPSARGKPPYRQALSHWPAASG